MLAISKLLFILFFLNNKPSLFGVFTEARHGHFDTLLKHFKYTKTQIIFAVSFSHFAASLFKVYLSL